MDDEAHAALLKAIGDASVRREAWDGVLDRLSVYAGARGVAVIPLKENTQGLRQTKSLDALADAYVSKGWAARDYRYRGMPKILAGQVTVDADFIDYDTLRHEAYYEDFLRPLGFRHFAGFGVRNGDDVWAVTLQRSFDDNPYSAAEQARLSTLIQPLQDAMKVGQILADAYQQGALDHLDVFGTPCLLLNRLGLVAQMNCAAHNLLGTVLDVRQGQIRLRSRDLSSRLHARIQRSLSKELDPKSSRLAPLVERSANHFCLFEVLRIPDMHVDAFSRYRCMVLIHRAGLPMHLEAAALQSVFALTRQEAALASALARSRDLVCAARDLGISHETARSQIRSIFDKTGARSQAKLLALFGDIRFLHR